MGANKILLVVVLLLAGCASTSESQQPPKPIEVKVPVPVPCQIEEPKMPEFSFETLTSESTIYQKVQILLADRLLHLGYEEQLRTALRGCKQ